MRSLNKPEISAEVSFKACIGKIRDKNLREKLEACSHLIRNSEEEFNTKATGQIYTIEKEEIVNENLDVRHFRKVYKNGMLAKNSQGRDIYDKILISVESQLCPLCCERVVSQIDHYLPQNGYPRLIVTPINLVPVCSECNRNKRDHYPSTAEEEALHPYYDCIEESKWLSARIVDIKSSILVKFYVDPPDDWDECLSIRVKNHFENLELNELYRVKAAGLMVELNSKLKSLYEKGGVQELREYLKDEAKTRYDSYKNHWKAALLYALAMDEKLCNLVNSD